ncbi:putative serine protease 45 isoform X1 [Mirounga angustirostris]|uniref:putative serine protease 45 isoform X1 n=1 Tax=Mirounga angustirostris TaxID=9716 RepID=UPI00313ABC10
MSTKFPGAALVVSRPHLENHWLEWFGAGDWMWCAGRQGPDAGRGDRTRLGRSWKLWKGACRPSGISGTGMSSSHSHEEYTVRLGDKLGHSHSETMLVVPVEDIICHRFYDDRTLRHDVALVLLAFSVNYSSYIQAVCLPERSLHVESGTKCWVTGWGQLAGETGYKGNTSIPVCGRPWWSEDLDVTRHWPWEVSLRLENEHVCGGALIDLNWVVTAAHCIQGTKEYSVILGTSKLKPLQAALIPVKDIVMHPKFWGRTFIMGDVALLQLHSPATFSKYVQPICLPEPSYNLKVGTQCWVTGWGQVKQRFSANSTLTAELQEAEVFIMDNKKCDQIYRKKSPIPHLVPLVLGDMICATNYGENLCSGDSGGPLACEVEGTWILAGVLSWEKACAKAENPGVYTRVTKYSKWIKKQISSGALSGPQTSAWFLLLFWLLQPQLDP